MRWVDLFYLNRYDRRILLSLLSVAALLMALLAVVDSHTDDAATADESPLAPADTMTTAPAATAYYQQPARPVERFPFDPNTADSTQLLRLGLQPWQVRNIYKYRAAGGIYRRKDDFARLYGLTVRQYRELEPFIRISPDYQPAATLVSHEAAGPDTLHRPHKLHAGQTVDLNSLDTAAYQQVPGIGSYYARRILQYGQRLGGFVSTAQLDEIDDLPTDFKTFFTVTAGAVRPLAVNRLSLNELKRHPYLNYYQARAIVDYRRQHGPLRSLDDLRLLPDFQESDFAKLKPYVEF